MPVLGATPSGRKQTLATAAATACTVLLGALAWHAAFTAAASNSGETPYTLPRTGKTPYTLHAPVSPCGPPERNQTPCNPGDPNGDEKEHITAGEKNLVSFKERREAMIARGEMAG